jgi:hypothetical protein
MNNEIRARVVVVAGDNETGIGVEVYRPNPPQASEVCYIASIYVNRSMSQADGLLMATEHIRGVYGGDRRYVIKTPHISATFQALRRLRKAGVENTMISGNNKRPHVYDDTKALAEDAIRRGNTITEML